MRCLPAVTILLVLITANVPAFAQSEDTHNDHDLLPSVQGTYVGNAGLVEISFPSGWKGAEIGNGTNTSAIVSQGGIGISNTPDYTKPLMMLIVSNNKNILEPGTFLAPASSPGPIYCTPLDTQRAWINGAFGVSSISSCSVGQEKVPSLRIKTLSVQTTTNWIIAAYSASESEFDQDLGTFDEALRSFKVFNPVEPSLDSPLTSSYYDFQSSGANVSIELLSTSKLMELKFDESNRILHLRLDEPSNASGMLLVPIGMVMKEPYSVMLDGTAVNKPDMLVKDEPDAWQMVRVEYPPGAHTLSIRGAQVVPEFAGSAFTFVSVGLILGLFVVISRGFKRFST